MIESPEILPELKVARGLMRLEQTGMLDAAVSVINVIGELGDPAAHAA